MLSLEDWEGAELLFFGSRSWFSGSEAIENILVHVRKCTDSLVTFK